ncbi:MAG: CDP-archaeol synthase, partial [Proteobacteria bacterium]|nr:CDP-archaeol synthase [Pseudomonadota bacterium]
SKTWRGLLITVLITPGVALLLGLGASTGLIIASMAMLGDLTSSFIKRRLGIRSSGIAPGLDQIPESLLPLWAVKPVLGLDWQQIMLIVAGFLLLGYVMSFVLYKLHVRRYPY